jgi:glycosyltransferase involved in cell wall biosynthesis
MRIGITMLSHDFRLGGPGTYTVEVVSRLLALDRANEYVLMYPAFGWARQGFGQYRQHPHVTEVVAQSRVPIKEHWEQLVVPVVAERRGADVVFGPLNAMPARGRFKKVMAMHGVELLTSRSSVTLMRSIRWGFNLRYVLPAADRVLTVSDTLTDIMAQVPRFDMSRARRVYLAASPRFRIVDDGARLAEFRRKYRLDEPYLLFVGKLFPQKNASTLFRAFARLKDRIPHRVVVVGGVRWKYEEDLALITELGIADRVTLVDHTQPDDLVLFYNLAACFVYPSLYETFGLAQIEAMGCGCPVIASTAGSIPEVAGGAALLVEALDDSGLADAIYRVITQPELRADLVRRGLARAANFSWDQTAMETLQIMQELCSGHSHPPPLTRGGGDPQVGAPGR